MVRDYDSFEHFADGRLIWRETVSGHEDAIRSPQESAHNVIPPVLKPHCKRLGIMTGAMRDFRHGRVSHLQANNVPGDFTKIMMGHASLRTASGYVTFRRTLLAKPSNGWPANCRLGLTRANWTQPQERPLRSKSNSCGKVRGGI